MVPKLVAEDIPLLNTLLSDVFPGVQYTPGEMTKLREMIASVCKEMYLVYSDGEEQGSAWVEKVTPLSRFYYVFLTQVVEIFKLWNLFLVCYCVKMRPHFLI